MIPSKTNGKDNSCDQVSCQSSAHFPRIMIPSMTNGKDISCDQVSPLLIYQAS